MTVDAKRTRAALHEAAHVVVARSCGYEVHKVEIYARGGGGCWAAIPPRDSLESIVAELGYYLAGSVAVELEASRSVWSWNFRPRDIVERELRADDGVRALHRALGDLQQIKRTDTLFDNCLGKALPETERVLRGRWKEVTKLAGRLLDEGVVDFLEEELRELTREDEERKMREPKMCLTKRRSGAWLDPVEIAACLRSLSRPGLSASDRSLIQARLAEGGFELVGSGVSVPARSAPFVEYR